MIGVITGRTTRRRTAPKRRPARRGDRRPQAGGASDHRGWV